MRAALVTLSFLALNACSGDKNEDTSPVDADTDTDVDTDADADTDTDADADADADADTDADSDADTDTAATGDTSLATTMIGTADTSPTGDTSGGTILVETGDTGMHDTSGPADTSPPTDTGDTSADDTGPVGPIGEGSVVLVHRLAAPTLFPEHVNLTALFADDLQGVTNAAECHPAYSYACVDAALAFDDSWVDVSAPFEAGLTTFFRAGATIDAGVYSAPGLPNPAHYDSGLLALAPTPDALLDLSIPGLEWPADLLPGAVPTPSTLVPTAPDPAIAHTWTEGQSIPFRWTAGGTGDVVLLISGPGLTRLYGLEDDGAFDLDLSSVPFATSGSVGVILGRRNEAQVLSAGGPIDVVARSDQWFDVSFQVGTQVLPADGCAAAALLAPLADGTYFGDLGTLANDLSPGFGGCTGFSATGPDGMLPITVASGETLTVAYDLPGNDASVYLVGDCADVDSCVAGADDTITTPEVLTYTNLGAVDQDLFLILDAYSTTSGPFTLEIVRTPATIAAASETCAQADLSPPIPPGSQQLTLAGRTDDLAPVPGTCVAARSDGSDAFLPIELAPGELATLSVDAGHLYLMDDCDDDSTCANPSLLPPVDRVQWLNDGATVARRTLVVDHDAGDPAPDVTLAYTREAVTVADGADDCTTALTLTSTPDGRYGVSLDGGTDTLQPTCAGGAAGGPDTLVPLDIPPYSVIEVELLSEGITAYLLPDCAAPASCVDAITQPGRLVVVNGTGATSTTTLVLDVAADRGERVAEFTITRQGAGTVLDDADTCAVAGGLIPVPDGRYQGDLSSRTNTLNPGNGGCTSASLPGPDALANLSLPAGEVLTIDVVTGADAVYLLTDCTTAGSCLVGSPLESSSSGPPALMGHNADVSPVDLTLVVDSTSAAAGAFVLDIDRRPAAPLAAADTCAAVDPTQALTTGAYGFTVSTAGLSDALDPGFDGCTAFSASGEDALVPVTLEDGETLDVHYIVPDGDASLYLLTDCADTTTCVAGIDSFGTGTYRERITYTHIGPAATYTLVLDAFVSGPESLLTVDIF